MVKAVYGKMATGLSNGWKDKRKRALLAYMANVNATAYTVGIKDILALPKTAENHLKVVKEAIKQCKEDLGMNIVDGCLMLEAICVIQLVVGDVLKLKNDLVAAGNNAQEIAKWFILHSQALGLLHDKQVKATGQSRILDHGILSVPNVFLPLLNNPSSGGGLETLNIAQAADTRLYHILVTLGRLYQLFNDPNIDPEVRIRPKQPRFFAPMRFTLLFNESSSGFFQKASESGLFEAFMSYYNWTNEFSAKAWHLKEYSDMYKNEGKDINLDAIWSTLPCPGTVNTGRHQLADYSVVWGIFIRSSETDSISSAYTTLLQSLWTSMLNTKPLVSLGSKRGDISTIPNNDSIDSGDEEEEEPGEQNLTTLATQFNQALDEDSDGDEELPVPSAVSSQTHTRPRRLRLYFSKAHAIPLSETNEPTFFPTSWLHSSVIGQTRVYCRFITTLLVTMTETHKRRGPRTNYRRDLTDQHDLRPTTMSLIHALVARESVILAENRSGKRDFSNAVATILSKIPPNNSKLTYVWEQYLFHYVSEDGLTFLVMADDAAGRRMPFTFIADLQRRFTTAYSRDQIDDAPAYGLNEFSSQVGKVGFFGLSKEMEAEQIAQLIEQYNIAPRRCAQSSTTRSGAGQGYHGPQCGADSESRERIELLVDKTDNMATQSTPFDEGHEQFEDSSSGETSGLWL
ncbi:VAMP synaptobrevin-like protein [Rhizoctonia solani]|uniref:VAMP synaptobrevin-like protein n=1 Tax=Rhizoctonia solani TaxID=456999 RepID=A0A8H7M1X8_9AGAM|nr:VAMP synaptobrevin-like protein [Rhizoctonia solani]